MNEIIYKTSDFILINPDTINLRIDPSPENIPKNRFYEVAKPYWLYALKLERNRYYVGSTSQKNPYDRIKQHIEKDGGAKWTALYPPIKVMEIRDAGIITRTHAESLERNLTSIYMNRYGVNKVRGGIFNSPEWMLPLGHGRVLLSYAIPTLVCGVLGIISLLYIILRHIFNWW